ncbi:MAG: hypothetical protein KC516_03120 [Nanoarchaeota archaeon]|nr:hypothetical protein [Nanoarchaeota archaeon]
MKDIFDYKILCDKCGKQMQNIEVSKNGFVLRALKCPNNHETIIHPEDKNEYDSFMKLKEKEYEVKMRMVGNSYAVSIPREIVDFMREQERMINDMVRLSFEDAGRLKLMFNTPENENSRVIKSREVRVVKNGKVYHAKQFSDSAHPERNKSVVLKREGDKNLK